MKQAVLKQQGVLAIADVQEDLTLQADEVLVEVKVVTICGSDLSYFQAETLPHDLQYPLVLGHEMAGIVNRYCCKQCSKGRSCSSGAAELLRALRGLPKRRL